MDGFEHSPLIALKNQIALLDDIIYELESHEAYREDCGMVDELFDIETLLKRLGSVRKRIKQYCRDLEKKS